MTQENKTELQEALDRHMSYMSNSVHMNKKPYSQMDAQRIHKAAQAYAYLPEKIEELKALTPHFGLDFGEDFEGGMDKMADEILKLLKEEV